MTKYYPFMKVMSFEEYKHLCSKCLDLLMHIKLIGQHDKKKENLEKTLFNSKKHESQWMKNFSCLEKKVQSCFEYLELYHEHELQREMCIELNNIYLQIKDMEIECLFTEKEDIMNALIDIHSGSGGIDAQDCASILNRMYMKFGIKKGFQVEIINLIEETVGIRSSTLLLKGQYAYGWLKNEKGIHRIVRKSPFDNQKRHTSFVSVYVYPEISQEIVIDILPSDLRIDTMRSSGAGGQHVNKTDSAVRIVHLPTGIKAECQNDRSQLKNKEEALKVLKAKLYNLEMEKRQSEASLLRKEKGEISWGAQIRSYVIDKSRITDIRTKYTETNISKVLDGDLENFIYESFKLVK